MQNQISKKELSEEKEEGNQEISIEIDLDFQNKIDNLFQEFLNSSQQAFYLETKNREIVYKIFKEKIEEKNKQEIKESEGNFFLNLKVFDIAKARELIEYENINFSQNRFFIISFYSINREAQNAILKLLEESRANTKILLITHKGANLLDTLISRSYKLEILNEGILSKIGEEEFITSAVEKFLATKNIQRMKLKEISEILDRKDEYALEFEDKERADREILENFLLKLHEIIFQKYEDFILNSQKNNENQNLEAETKESKFTMSYYQNKEFLSNLEDIREAIKYAKLNSSSGKTLLEYLALKLLELK